MTNDYDLEMSLDDTLELDAIIQEWDPTLDDTITISSNNLNITGIQTNTGIINPTEPGEYTVNINGQELFINVRDPNNVPDTETWDNLDNWVGLYDGIALDNTNSVSGDAAYLGHDQRGGSSPNSEDGGYNKITESASPTEATVETETYISSHNTDNNSAGIRFRLQDIDNHYVCGISTVRNDFWVNKHIDGSIYNVGTTNVNNSLSNGTFFTQKVEMVESGTDLQFILSIDGTKEAQITDTNPDFTGGGAIGVGMMSDDGGAANNNTAYTGWWTDNTKISY